MDARTVLRRARGWAAERLGANERARRRLDGDRAALLYYHRVLPEQLAARDCVEPGMYVTPESFAAQLDWLTEHFAVLPLHEIADRLESGKRLPERAVAITFDDGWRDNHDYAFEALSARGLPATIFVVTDRVGTSGAFWPDEVCRRMAPLSDGAAADLASSLGAGGDGAPVDRVLARLKTLDQVALCESLDALRAHTRALDEHERELMDWDEIDRVSAGGIDIESHGASHAILTAISPEAAAKELAASREALLERGHGRHGLLAYPSGGYDEGVVQAARAAGYRAAVTIEAGLAGREHGAFALPRICIHQGIAGSRGEFLLKVPGRA